MDEFAALQRVLLQGLQLGIAASLAAWPAHARADLDQGLQTLWESLWHQSGTPTRLARWESDIRVRVTGVRPGLYRPVVLRALREVTGEAGVELTDLSTQPGQRANLVVEIVPDTALENHQPCVTTVELNRAVQIEAATVRMRQRDVGRCVLHETMHVMGIRGHPAGPSVLSYFPVRADTLLPLDRVMLRAWYSRQMPPGATPFEALPVLAQTLWGEQADTAAAHQRMARFWAATHEHMQAFALGQSDGPAVVRRSGKLTAQGLEQGRREMSYFLGLAYLQGTGLPAPDPEQARRWLNLAAGAGHPEARAQLGAFP